MPDPALRIFPDEYVPNAEGVPYHRKWVRANPNEAAQWAVFRDAVIRGEQPAPPVMATKYGRALVAAGKEHMSITRLIGTPISGPPEPGEPGPENRYTDINFADGQYWGEGIETVFEAWESDARLSDWGGLPSDYYDDPGAFGYSPPDSMTTDTSQRVHLFDPTDRGLPPNPAGGNWASWQELRSTDGYWADGYDDLAKSSLQGGPLGGLAYDVTWGPSGFSVGDVRWWAWDYLLPLNIDLNGNVSFEFVNSWTAYMDLHASSGVDGDPSITSVRPESGNPRYLMWMNSPVTQDPGQVPYVEVELLQLTDSSGNRNTGVYNVWHELVVGMKASKDSSGWYEIWHDGVQLVSQTSRTMLNQNDSGPYLQIQNYTSYPTSFVGGATRGAIVYGGFRAGLVRTDVQIS